MCAYVSVCMYVCSLHVCQKKKKNRIAKKEKEKKRKRVLVMVHLVVGNTSPLKLP